MRKELISTGRFLYDVLDDAQGKAIVLEVETVQQFQPSKASAEILAELHAAFVDFLLEGRRKFKATQVRFDSFAGLGQASASVSIHLMGLYAIEALSTSCALKRDQFLGRALLEIKVLLDQDELEPQLTDQDMFVIAAVTSFAEDTEYHDLFNASLAKLRSVSTVDELGKIALEHGLVS